MEQILDIQKTIFQQIKDKLHPSHSVVHEISELLNISYDSAYRRIRGEKALTFEELYKISTRFEISVDTLFNVTTGNVVFNCLPLSPDKFEVKDWLNFILQSLSLVTRAKDGEIIYSAADIPMFHYFQFPEIAAFKVFFWEKTLFQFPEYEDKLFRLDDADPNIPKIGKQILALANKIPTTEIWNEDTFNIMLRQVEFYWVSGFFKKKDDLINLCDKIEKWVHHIKKQAECGFKFFYEQPAEGLENTFLFYNNEVVQNDNTIFVKADDQKMVYLTFNVLSILTTNNTIFCNLIENYLKGLMTKSNLISRVGEKGRSQFFNKQLHAIEQFKSRICE
ncbi:MAG: hypothetical protein AMS27_13465 [Bacteroides sp. SM23_62_1]|nr:MAG: hypothetical protein AMS27_13465 [Bacteroides sp. SM23_62_1]